MKQVLMLSLLFLFTIRLGAQDKAALDLPGPGFQKTVSTTASWPYDYQEVQNDRTAFTLTSGGYFTIGTTSGLSDSNLDDNCQVTYGHPYAMTSYPVFFVDGSWYRFDDYLKFTTSTAPAKTGDTLKITGTEDSMLQVEFSMWSPDNGNSITLSIRIKNLDAQSHTLGTGVVIDPALGKWGDGCLEMNGSILQKDSIITGEDIPSTMSIWERSGKYQGMGIALDFGEEKPAQMLAANWQDIYNSAGPDLQQERIRLLYDLVLKVVWTSQELQPGEEKSRAVTLSLLEPQFPGTAMLRWDMPSFFSIENNLMFPRDLSTLIEVIPAEASGVENAWLTLGLPKYLTTSSSEFTLSASGTTPFYQQVNLQSRLVYEDKVVTTKLALTKDGVILDELVRNILLPATPVSDTGLLIINDSLSTSAFPDLQLIFGVEVEKTGQRIRDLTDDNIFLYENGSRIQDFTLEKYKGGGSDLVDIIFVLDVSGSMGDEINQVRENLNEFADSLWINGYDFKIGVVTFSTTVDHVWDLTDDVEQIKQNLASIVLWGGVEDSPAALYQATELSLRPGSRRTIIWVTDEPYPETSYTKEEIVNRMLSLDITVHGVGLNELQTDWFNPIVLPTGGNFYNINGNFRDILLDVTRFSSQTIYSLSYLSLSAIQATGHIELWVRYAGLGGSKTYDFTPPESGLKEQSFTFFPNPFNSTIIFEVNRPDYPRGEINIYNILGQRVKTIPLNTNGPQRIAWNAMNDQGRTVSTGFYIAELSLFNKAGKIHRETVKILYLK